MLTHQLLYYIMAIRSFQSCKQMFVKAVRSASAGLLNIFWQWDTRRWTRTLRNLWWRASPSIRCCRCCWLRTEIALLRPARFSFHFAFSSQCLWRLINESIQASSVRLRHASHRRSADLEIDRVLARRLCPRIIPRDADPLLSVFTPVRLSRCGFVVPFDGGARDELQPLVNLYP